VTCKQPHAAAGTRGSDRWRGGGRRPGLRGAGFCGSAGRPPPCAGGQPLLLPTAHWPGTALSEPQQHTLGAAHRQFSPDAGGKPAAGPQGGPHPAGTPHGHAAAAGFAAGACAGLRGRRRAPVGSASRHGERGQGRRAGGGCRRLGRVSSLAGGRAPGVGAGGGAARRVVSPPRQARPGASRSRVAGPRGAHRPPVSGARQPPSPQGHRRWQHPAARVGRAWVAGRSPGWGTGVGLQPPNKGLQATGNSLRSSLAPALSRA